MNILFKNRRLEKLCNNFNKLVKKYGNKRAKIIIRRLSELKAMENLGVARKLPQLRCHELKGDRKGELAVDLDHPYRLIFTVAQEPIPVKDDGGLDWEKVHSIKILEIEDYHGKHRKK